MKKRTLPRWGMKNRAVAGPGRSISLVLICISGGVPTEIVAQEPLSFEPGARVRVTAPGCGLRGGATGLSALRGDTLVLENTECPMATVTRFEVSRGQKSNLMRGAGIGFAAGVVGTLVGCLGGSCEFGDNGVYTDLRPEFAIAVGLMGGVVGGIIGYFVKTERWEEVPLDRLRVSLTPQRDGQLALAFSVKF